VGEDREDCPPPYNVALEFSLPVAGGGDRFLDEIHSVDALVLDSAGGFLRLERVERAALEVYQGLRLFLPPGRYRVTCWGNRTDNTGYEGLSAAIPPEGIAYSSIPNDRVVGDGDPLYRAPRPATTRATRAMPTQAPMLTGAERAIDGLLTLEVPAADADVVLPVEFSAAHRIVEVRVVGYDAGRSLPDVEIAGLPAGDELLTGLSLLDASLAPRLVTSRKNTATGDDPGAVATFTTFRFALDDPEMVIRVLHPVTGARVYSVALADLVGEIDSDATSLVIRVTIAFINGRVEVSIEGWKKNDVSGG
jgi:hypothetical protein